MRKWMLIGAISCLLLTACSTQADNNTEVQQLKVENDKLQKKLLNYNKNHKNTTCCEWFEANTRFQNEVSSIVEKANNTKPVGVKEDNLNTYLAVKKKLTN